MKRTEFYLTALILVLSVGLAWGAVSDIFVLGDTPNPPSGYTYTKMTVYSSDRWTKKANMPTARAGLAAVAVNGAIYAIGGAYEDYSYAVQEDTYEYNPATNKWTTKADMPTARGRLAAAEVNGMIYAIGGVNVNDKLLQTNAEYSPPVLFYIHRRD